MKTINFFRSKLFALTLALMASVSTFAYNFGDDGLFFNIIDNDNKLVEVTYQHERSEKNYSNLTHVTIPDTVLRGRVKYAVVSIGDMAFYNCQTLESIVIPDHIKSIGTNAFDGCSALTTISLPSTITYLNSSLFANCTALRSFTIPDNITSIYGSVFENCSSLSEVNIPYSVTSIGKYAFKYCNSLKSITIPNSVKNIERGAFYKCKALTDIKLPDSLITITQDMFYECTALESISIPAGSTHIEHNAFYWCSKLKTITLHGKIEYIDEWAFNQTEISTFVLAMKNAEEACNNRVNKILYDIRQQYSTRKITIAGEKVRDLVIPNTVDSISDYAFAYSYIASVDVPNNLKRINPTAFHKCPSLQSVYWNTLDFEEVDSTTNAPFNKVASQIHTFKFGQDIKHIPAYLCYDMNRLDSIEIPAGVKSIGKHAFAHCSPSVVICHASQVPNIDESAFSKDYVSNTILYVPAESVETYKDSEQWNKFAHIVAIGEEINDTDSDWDWWLVHDFAVDNFGYAIIENATTPSVQIIEAVGKSGHVDIPTEVIHNDTLYKVTGLGTGIVTTFRYSPDLTSVFIPKEILLVNNAVFADCPNLESIVVEEGNVHQDSRDNCNAVIRNLFADRSPELVIGCKNTTIPDGVLSIGSYAFRGCKGLQEIEVPSSVTTIYQDAFYDCISLKSVVLGENITSINDLAFYNCYNLEKVVCLALTPPSKGASAFNNTPITNPDIEERAPIYVPDASVEVYKQAWKDYNIQPLSSMPSYKSQWCDTWNVMWFDGMYFDETASTTKYRLGKDTIIGDYTYSKFTSSTSVRFTDDRKVYVYYEGFDDNDPYSEDLPTGEYLAYDFSAQVGDTLEVFSGVTYNTKTYKCVVSDVQTDLETNLLTIKLHPLVVVDGNGNVEVSSEEITWIEGVGSPNGFLFDDPKPGGGLFTLLCAYQDDELKYTGSFYERFGCDYNAGVISDDLFPTLSGLQRTICREYCEQADNKTLREEYTNLTTRTENDRPYIYCSPFLLREEDNKILIYSRSLNKDLVLYDFNLQVGDSLPMLYIDTEAKDDWIADRDMDIWYVVDYHKDLEGNILPADTLIVTDVSMITLLDGKAYKKWTFNNGMEYVEGIGSFGNGQWSGDFFQLIANKDVPTCLLDEHLVCVSKNNKLLYMMDDAEMERLGAECLCDVEKKWSDTWCDTWNIMEHNVQLIGDYNEETWRYYLAEDTTINGTTYTPVNRYWTADKTKRGFVATIRFTEDQKVYALLGDTEYLVYDFSVQVGDTIETIVGVNCGTMLQQLLVHQVDIDDATNRKTITLYPLCQLEEDVDCDRCDENGYYLDLFPIQWIEGVGSTDGFLMGDRPCSDWVGGIGHKLLCAYKDDELQYINDLYQDDYGCEYNAVGQNPEALFPTLWGLQRTICLKNINENEVGTVWGSRSYLMQEIETTTIDEKQYLLFGTNNTYDEYCSLWLREENNKILVYSAAQKKDLVLYDFTLNVGDSLPRLYVDEELSSIVDYYKYEADWEYTKPLFVTEVSTITLLDGKEYKKWTFDNGMEYVEGIGSFGTSYAWNDFYQLIANGPLYSDVFSQHLVCASKNGQLLYKMDDAEMEQLETECLCEIEPKWSETWCNQWNILSHGYQGPQDPLAAARTSIFWLSNNTVNRDGQEYIPLMCSSSKPDVESTNLIGELRFTEDKQVYFYYDNTEYLLYDFGAQVGDQLQIFSGIDNYNRYKTYTHVVTRREYLEDGRIKLTSIPFFDEPVPDVIDENYYLSVTWIEGVGSEHGIVHNNINYIPGMGTDWLLCAYRDGECRYTTDDPEYAPLGCVYNDGDFIEDAFPILSGLQRTVCNEYCGDTEDDNSANNTYKQTFDSIFFENDKPYILCNDYLLREEDNKILIYSQLLNKDLVLYDFTLEVGDSLPALYIDWQYHNAMDWIPYNLDVVDYNKDFDGTIYPADTFVVTDVSNVTLLDGKEYKKWTFDNGMEYVEGIGMYGGRRNGNFFGLIQEVVVPCHTGTHLVCVSKNNKLLYQMDDTEMERLGAECLCDYNRGPRKDNAKNGKIGGRPTPTQWNMLEVDLREMENSNTILRAETFSYTLENDSIVTNGKTFYQLARQSTKDTAITKSFVGALHFSEDEGNRVYFLCDGEEYLLYDFTAEPGDTVEIFAGINNYPQETTYTHVVTDRDTLENGACRMFLEVVFPDETNIGENTEKVWLAGLGSVDGIVHNATKQTRDAYAAPSRSARSSETHTSIMLCAWREDSCLYTTDHPDYDNFGCVYNQDPTSVSNTPSPMTDCQKLLVDGQLLIIYEGKTYNVLGMPIQR